MKDTKELEFKIFACILLNPKIIDEFDFEEKYFKYNGVLKSLINLYYKYQGLDTNILIENNYNDTTISIIEHINMELNWNNIYGYYNGCLF